jgi:hypothetical protein
MKLKVYSSQYSYFFGSNQIHFPYSIASIISYSKQFKEIDENYEFQKCFLVRNKIEEDIKSYFDIPQRALKDLAKPGYPSSRRSADRSQLLGTSTQQGQSTYLTHPQECVGIHG